jgi:hypothetical protein
MDASFQYLVKVCRVNNFVQGMTVSTGFGQKSTKRCGLDRLNLIKGPVAVEGIWNAFAECNFWFRNLNRTPLVFLKPSSQVNNFTVFFHFFMGMSKSVFSICLG